MPLKMGTLLAATEQQVDPPVQKVLPLDSGAVLTLSKH